VFILHLHRLFPYTTTLGGNRYALGLQETTTTSGFHEIKSRGKMGSSGTGGLAWRYAVVWTTRLTGAATFAINGYNGYQFALNAHPGLEHPHSFSKFDPTFVEDLALMLATSTFKAYVYGSLFYFFLPKIAYDYYNDDEDERAIRHACPGYVAFPSTQPIYRNIWSGWLRSWYKRDS